MATKPNMFSLDAAKRHQEQTALTNELTGAPKPPTRKVPMNITLPLDHKNKLVAAAKAKGLSASVIIQMWIDEHCN